jgi:hypothetical protein
MYVHNKLLPLHFWGRLKNKRNIVEESHPPAVVGGGGLLSGQGGKWGIEGNGLISVYCKLLNSFLLWG